MSNIGFDKVVHFILAAIICTAIGLQLQCINTYYEAGIPKWVIASVASANTIVLCIGWEVVQKFWLKKKFDAYDIVAGAVGCLLVFVCLLM